ncbi:response regulator [Acuticoccus sp. MNP-M23]|uniref:response regulator n=1 Tax=Acuticoccus sp. MNP-M23 TaxID=3072793 RepID=UPI002815C465|nr:response regulator [Acuticoccus sp. MNP-M23]WMS42786.1 response regulator [Acuticoccus sp. MNP-M23]
MADILVVDDEEDSFEIVRSLLAAGGHTATWAQTPADAVAKTEATPFDCIIVDYFLGAETGFDLIAQVQRSTPLCPILLLTGSGSEDLAASSIRLGASNYLSKAGLTAEKLNASIEAALAEAEERRAAEEERASQARRGRLEALGQLAGGIAHDINNLLASVQYTLASVPLAALPEPIAARLTSAMGTLQGGARLTDRLTAFAADRPGTAEPCPLAEMIESVSASVTSLLGTGIALRKDIDDQDAQVLCDPKQLEHALVNLILNSRHAIQSSGRGSQIKISARKAEAHSAYLLAVEDDGPGMAADVAASSIDPYFTTKPRGTSTGLGLSTVYGFVQQAGGKFDLVTEEGRGTKVSFTLPGAVAERRDPPPTVPLRVSRDATAENPQSAPRILLVEDDIILRSGMALTLEQFGYQLVEAGTAEECIGLVNDEDSIDVMVTDIHLGDGMNGFELARKIRDSWADIGIIYMSGFTGYSKDEMGEIKAPLISKPFMPETLNSHIQSILESRNNI